MMTHSEQPLSSKLEQAIHDETQKFKEYYLWLEQAMPPAFFKEVSDENIILIVHDLIGFPLQEHFTRIHLKRSSIVICLDSADADLRILKGYALYGIKNYQAYVSSFPPPMPEAAENLRIVQIFFSEAIECAEAPWPIESKEELRALVKQRNPDVTDKEFETIISSINIRFLRSLPIDRLILALDMFFRAKTRDNCQYEVRYNENWKEEDAPSMQIVLAWRNTPKHHFFYRIARIIHRYGLVMKKVNAAYIDPYSKQNILVMALGLHGSRGEAVWDVADIPDFLRELATVKYFASFDLIDRHLIKRKVIPGKLGNFMRAAMSFVHQALVNIDVNLYTLERIEEDLCRHPELTEQICRAFELKFDPNSCDYDKYLEVRERCLHDIDHLDTGHPGNDLRRKNVLRQAMNLIHYALKTNYYRLNYTAISFRIDPKYLDDIPFHRKEKFPELPFGIIYIKGMHFFGFHIRFKDLARGGLRTVYPTHREHVLTEQNHVFTECYHLALTQQKKNKDIPEGGSKAIIFLKPYDRLESEAMILKKELEDSQVSSEDIQLKLDTFREEQKVEYLYQAQRSFIESLITIVNCEPDGTIRAKSIVDYWKRPEYIYLGPDENMHDSMIQWIAEFSKKYGYKPGVAFISGKPKLGINHKEFGVTSLGVNVYMEALLKYLGIDPYKETFTVKMSGGPDGDVAGNQLRNLYNYYPKTAKLVALTDISGTIFDPGGLYLDVLVDLFYQTKSIKFYPPDKLHEGGFLVDKQTKRKQTAFAQQTLCWRMEQGQLREDWLSGSQMNHLFRNNVHQAKSDIFIPAGGRPRTLNRSTVDTFLDVTGRPTSRGIVEGANLYLTNDARHFLEERGVLVIKDSSANKAGVICSSFEVMCGLVLDEKTFLEYKRTLVYEILDKLKQCAADEANLLFDTLKKRGGYLTEISDEISSKINAYTYQLLDHLESFPLPGDPNDPLIKTFLSYAPSTLMKTFPAQLLSEIPDHHKKAIISSHLAADLVYKKGLDWRPSLIDILPILLKERT
ncbi:MAG: NAD-glutamate dehydrogenase domain-containing protein [Waddliaceae bacterium]